MLSGRWLAPSDTNAVVLNQTASAFFPDAQVGDDIKLMMAGKSVTLKLVGIVRQLLTPATAYVAPSMFAEATSQSLQSTNAVRVVMNQHDADAVRAITGKIETSSAAQSIGMKMVISESALESATSGHVYIFIFALILPRSEVAERLLSLCDAPISIDQLAEQTGFDLGQTALALSTLAKMGLVRLDT